MLASCSVNLFYFIYVKKKYKKLKFVFCKDKTEYKMVFSYLNWNLIGSIASVCKSQGVNIIINIFFGSSINAARGIAAQVNNAIVSFSQNFMKAIDPQITKAYANKNKDEFLNLINIASKLSFSLLFVVSIPVIFNSNYILTLWLKNVPEYTVFFTNLVLIDALVFKFNRSYFDRSAGNRKSKTISNCYWWIKFIKFTGIIYILKSVANSIYSICGGYYN